MTWHLRPLGTGVGGAERWLCRGRDEAQAADALNSPPRCLCRRGGLRSGTCLCARACAPCVAWLLPANPVPFSSRILCSREGTVQGAAGACLGPGGGGGAAAAAPLRGRLPGAPGSHSPSRLLQAGAPEERSVRECRHGEIEKSPHLLTGRAMKREAGGMLPA